MKKIILIAAGALFFGTSATFAQDTLKQKQQPTPEQQQPKKDQTGIRPTDDATKGWTKVNSADVPSQLRQTLSGTQYTGWEKSTIYKSMGGDRYSVRIDQGPTYYFDKEGKAVTGPTTKPKD